MSKETKSTRQHWRMEIQNWLIGQRWQSHERFRVADLGCEWGWSGEAIRERWQRAHIIGVDLFGPYLDHVREHRPYNEVIEQDVLEYVEGLGRLDVILAAEILEHLDHDQGLRLLELLVDKAGLAIVTTPEGYIPQEELDGNPLQQHRSGWTMRELVGAGFEPFLTMHYGYGMLVAYAGRLRR